MICRAKQFRQFQHAAIDDATRVSALKVYDKHRQATRSTESIASSKSYRSASKRSQLITVMCFRPSSTGMSKIKPSVKGWIKPSRCPARSSILQSTGNQGFQRSGATYAKRRIRGATLCKFGYKKLLKWPDSSSDLNANGQFRWELSNVRVG